ncbi:uncharacterized protein VTP21DRAFT_5355 [Calcarisporiella thermophila]|uniref:uncharacterized protein n=1 Tax=Calcarisporiella thermophila TaxID=911321 RepID=UPI003742821B
MTESATPTKVHLTLLLVSGLRHSFVFNSQATVWEVKREVYDSWPKEWQDEKPISPNQLRLLYLGRFLDEHTTLESNRIYAGSSTVAHLTIRPFVDDDDDDIIKPKNAQQCRLCTIL